MSKPLDDRSAIAFLAQPRVKAILDSFGPVDPDAYRRLAEAPRYELSPVEILTGDPQIIALPPPRC